MEIVLLFLGLIGMLLCAYFLTISSFTDEANKARQIL